MKTNQWQVAHLRLRRIGASLRYKLTTLVLATLGFSTKLLSFLVKSFVVPLNNFLGDIIPANKSRAGAISFI